MNPATDSLPSPSTRPHSAAAHAGRPRLEPASRFQLRAGPQSGDPVGRGTAGGEDTQRPANPMARKVPVGERRREGRRRTCRAARAECASADLVVVGRRIRRSPVGAHIGHVAHAVMHHAEHPSPSSPITDGAWGHSPGPGRSQASRYGARSRRASSTNAAVSPARPAPASTPNEIHGTVPSASASPGV